MIARGRGRAAGHGPSRLLNLPGVQWVQADAATGRLTVGGTVRAAEALRGLHELGHDSGAGGERSSSSERLLPCRTPRMARGLRFRRK